MLAMLLLQREQLLASDESESLGLLMHYPEEDVTNVLKMAIEVQKGTYEPPSNDDSSSSLSSATAAVVVGRGKGKTAKAASATRPNWLASASSTRGHLNNPVHVSEFSKDDSEILNSGSTRVRFAEKAGENLTRGLNSIEKSLNRVSGALKQSGVMSPALARVEELGSSLLHNAKPASLSSSAENDSQPHSVHDALFGSMSLARPESKQAQLSGDSTNALQAAITSPTTSSLNQSAPPLATPSKERAAAVVSGLASSVNIGDRLLSIGDELGQRSRSYKDELLSRKAAAVKLRLLADLLDGSTILTLNEYDHMCALAARGEEMSYSMCSMLGAEPIEGATTTDDESHGALMDLLDSRPSKGYKQEQEEDKEQEQEEDKDKEKEKEKEKEQEKEKETSHSTNLSFLEEDFEEDHLFKPAARAKKKTSEATDEAFALLLGDHSKESLLLELNVM